MEVNALSVANAFIDIAKDAGKDIRLLGLIKRVYIAHGLSLALRNKGLLDKRFDEVEAWKYGPVIPSVYHSFKYNRDTPITEKSFFVRQSEDSDDLIFETPELKDKEAMDIVRNVWELYEDKTDSELVTLLHKKGTPWHYCYKRGQNAVIPDYVTKTYYELLLKANGY